MCDGLQGGDGSHQGRIQHARMATFYNFNDRITQERQRSGRAKAALSIVKGHDEAPM